MPYRLEKVANGGDCFFDSVARHLNHEGIGWAPDGEWDAGTVRATMMRHAAEEIFGPDQVPGGWEWDLETLSQLPLSPESELLEHLKSAFDGISSAVYAAWEELWRDPTNRPLLVALFLRWGLMDELTSERRVIVGAINTWLVETKGFNWLLRNSLVWGVVVLEGESGFYERILRKLWNLEVEIVVGPLVDDDHRREGTLLLCCEKLHYQPYLWRSNVSVATTSLREWSAPVRSYSAPPIDTGSATSAARHEPNTRVAPLRLGLCVWNLNHLGEQSQGQKRTRDEDVPDDPSEGRPTKRRRIEPAPLAVVPPPPRKRARNDCPLPFLDPTLEEEGDSQPSSEPAPKKRRRNQPEPAGDGAPEDAGDGAPEDPEKANSAQNKVDALRALIERNADWLDVVALNEVNKGVDFLKKESAQWKSPRCTLYEGPHLISVGEQLGAGQHEYYPLLIVDRPGRFKIEHQGCSVFFSTGVASHKKVAQGEEVRWIKKENLTKAESDAAYREAVVKAAEKLLHLIEAIEGRSKGKRAAKEKQSIGARGEAAASSLERLELEDEDMSGAVVAMRKLLAATTPKDAPPPSRSKPGPRSKSGPSSEAGPRSKSGPRRKAGPSSEGKAERKGERDALVRMICDRLEAANEGVNRSDLAKRIEGVRASCWKLNSGQRSAIIEEVRHHLYRPVVIHHLLVGGKQSVNVGIVHTTPGGTEFERKMVYSQLKKFFNEVASGWQPDGVEALWLIAGDFYLLDESVVTSEARKGYQTRTVRTWKDRDDPIAKDVIVEANKARGAILLGQIEALKREIDAIDEAMSGARTSSLTQADGARGASELAKLKATGVKLCEEAMAGQRAKIQDLLDVLTAATEKWEDNNGSVSIWKLDADVGKAHSGLILLDRLAALQAGKLRLKDEEQCDTQLLLRAMTATLKKGFVDFTGLKGQIIDFERNVKKSVGVAEDEQAGGTGKIGKERDEYLSTQSYSARNLLLSARPEQRLRKDLGLTFAAQIEEHFHIYQTIWATNVHSSAKVDSKVIEYTAFRIADFVVASEGWRSAELGLFHHEKKGLLRVEDEEHDAEGSVTLPSTVTWRAISDHFPVGARFSTRAHDLAVRHVFVDALDEDLYAEKRWAMAIWHMIDACQMLGGGRGPDDWWLEKDNEERYRNVASDFAVRVMEVLGEDEDKAGVVEQPLLDLLDAPPPDPDEVFEMLNRILSDLRTEVGLVVVEPKRFPFYMQDGEEDGEPPDGDGEASEGMELTQ
ncbi:hypothetical protein [Sorangium sp. So ce1182]|uniref:hypothetical protein n=1 Tax=Sorangium sp. So ce1182 TaxID=3133334 RepID=UPI003F6471A0